MSGVLLLVVGALALYGRATVLDEQAFADRATAALAQDEVQDEVGTRIADRAIEADPALAQLRPTVEAAVSDAVRSWTFPAHFHDGVEAMHRSLFSGGSVDLALPGSRRGHPRRRPRALAGALTALARRSHALPPRRRGPGDAARRVGADRPAGGDASPRSRWPAGCWLLVAAAFRAPTLRRGARRAALGLALTGGVLVAVTSVGRAVVLSSFDTSHGDAVVGTIWDSFLGDLRFWGLVVGAGGVIAAALFEPGARGAWRTAARPGAHTVRVGGAPGPRRRAARPRRAARVDAGGPGRSRGHHARRRLLFVAAAEVVRVSSAR